MTYDDHARKVAIKAIGTVESGLNYGSINYNDPITLGIGQWYGSRAANLLKLMKAGDNWSGVASSIESDMSAHGTGAWWNNRYLTRAEGTTIKKVLVKNKDIQNKLFADDIDGYKTIAVRLGMDADKNTDAMILWMVGYHQSPKRANQVLARYGPNSSLDRLLAGFLNEPVLGQYRSRYNTAAKIIKSGDTSGVDDLPGDDSDDSTEWGDIGGEIGGRLGGVFSHVVKRGSGLYAFKADGNAVEFVHGGPNTFISGQDKTTGADVPHMADGETGSVPPSADVKEKQDALRQFVLDEEKRWNYGNGPGRLTPEKSGYCDCSSFLYRAFNKVLGIKLGTYTVSQMNDGTRIAAGKGNMPLDKMQVGDLILYNTPGGRSTVDHVEVYMGNNDISGHGGGLSGTEKGPRFKKDMAQRWANMYINWYIQRVIK